MIGKNKITFILVTTVLLVLIAKFFLFKGSEEGMIIYDGPSRIYGGCKYASVIRIDDFIVDSKFSRRIPIPIVNPNNYFNNYENIVIEWMLKEEPGVPLTVGVITGCPSGNCSYYWDLYSYLVKENWEIASHSRWHLRPPREPSDYLGSIKDIESNITGYRVVTYIAPFGKFSKNEINKLEKKTCVRIVMTTWPFQLRMPKFSPGGITKLGFTIKLSQYLPWKPYLWIVTKIAEEVKGLVVIYTHATSYDWRSPSSLISSINYVINYLNRSKAWITTPRELFAYELEISSIRIIRINATSFKVIYKYKLPCSLKKVPITIRFTIAKEYSVRSVLINGTKLPRLKAIHYCIMTKRSQWYFIYNKKVYITFIPQNNDVITLIVLKEG